jgi:hypothetical protein
MEWWVWVILVVAALAAVLVFFQRRSRNKALSRGLADGHRWDDKAQMGDYRPVDRHSDLEKPHGH